MAKHIIHKISEGKYTEVCDKIQLSIRKINCKGFSAEGIIIAVPKYFSEAISYQQFGSILQTPKTFFGQKIVPSFDNCIIVYHEDMPTFGDKDYCVIDLSI